MQTLEETNEPHKDVPKPLELYRYVGHRLREVLLLPQIARRQRAPRVIFFPSSAPEGASLLRAYNIATGLNKMGWDAITVPHQLERIQRERIIEIFKPNLIVFQQCRHILNHSEGAFGIPYVLDIDDADFLDSKQTQKLEATAKASVGIIAGSRFIKFWAEKLNGNVVVVWTGNQITPGPRPDHKNRNNIITWAQSEPLSYHAELEFLKEVVLTVNANVDNLFLRMYGVETEAARSTINSFFNGRVRLQMFKHVKYSQFMKSLRDVAVGFSPIIASEEFSRGKSFGKILGYLDAFVPVITSLEADHELFFNSNTGVVSNDPHVWIESTKRLLRNPEARNEMSHLAFQDYNKRLSTETSCRLTHEFLKRLL